jgi:hypothetical protein
MAYAWTFVSNLNPSCSNPFQLATEEIPDMFAINYPQVGECLQLDHRTVLSDI